MTITRRGIVTSSAAGVGIAVTGRFPSLAEARPGSAPGHVRSHVPSRRWSMTRGASWPSRRSSPTG